MAYAVVRAGAMSSIPRRFLVFAANKNDFCHFLTVFFALIWKWVNQTAAPDWPPLFEDFKTKQFNVTFNFTFNFHLSLFQTLAFFIENTENQNVAKVSLVLLGKKSCLFL